MKPKIVVLGSMCRLPVPGVVYQLLHYLIGLERLGFDTHYVEWHGNWVNDPAGPPPVAEPRAPVAAVLDRHGFGDRWSCLDAASGPAATFGPMGSDQLPALYRDAVAIINVTGAHVLTPDMMACPVRILVESDPGIPEIRIDRGDEDAIDLFSSHTHISSFGELLGRAACPLPTAFDYIATRQPVVIDMWDTSGPPGASVTTIARWAKPKDKSIEFRGSRYEWDKRFQFGPYVALPVSVDRPLSMALSEVTAGDREELAAHGWHIVDAMRDCVDLDDYRSFVQGSWAEFTVAKDQYVRLGTGWFSDRSACYLASGRPVVTQDTGFGAVLPTGAGLFAFADSAEAVAALEEIERAPAAHRRAARELSREYFDSDRVLTDLLGACGIAVPGRPRIASARDPALWTAVDSVATRLPETFLDELAPGRIVRIGGLDEGQSVIAKRVTVARARVGRHVTRLLSLAGLTHLAVDLLAESREDDHHWQVFEDLGTASLARTMTSEPSAYPEDLGFLNPLAAAVPEETLEAVMTTMAKLHRGLAGADDLLCLPPRNGWFVRSTTEAAIGEMRRAERIDDRWAAACDPLVAEMQRTLDLLEEYEQPLSDLGPEVLLHGDLGPNNVMLTETGPRLIDWDHAGRGPVEYDLSTFVSQLSSDQRGQALTLYAQHHPDHSVLPSETIEPLFELFERGRLASATLWAARARLGDEEWSRQQVASCLDWFAALPSANALSGSR